MASVVSSTHPARRRPSLEVRRFLAYPVIDSAQEFIKLRTSELPDEYHRAAHEQAPDAVWRELVANHPEMRLWVAHNKTVPVTILELLHTDPSADVRCTVARKRKLPERLQQTLATDCDASVRHALACSAKVAPAVLQTLASDAESFVREAALQRLHSHERNT